MAEQDTLPRKAAKFFFDQNNFNDDYVEEPEIPPPPMFSEDELAAAKKDAYARGKKDGIAETEAKIERRIGDLLAVVVEKFTTLFSAEQARGARYEAESVSLTRAALSRLFPYLNEKHGLEEVGDVLIDVMETHRTPPEITIEVPEDYVEPIRERLHNTLKNIAVPGVCTVIAGKNMAPGSCRMQWLDGGASRNAVFLAEQIMKHLEQTLADKPRLQDNGGSDLPDTDSGGATRPGNGDRT